MAMATTTALALGAIGAEIGSAAIGSRSEGKAADKAAAAQLEANKLAIAESKRQQEADLAWQREQWAREAEQWNLIQQQNFPRQQAWGAVAGQHMSGLNLPTAPAQLGPGGAPPGSTLGEMANKGMPLDYRMGGRAPVEDPLAVARTAPVADPLVAPRYKTLGELANWGRA